HRVIDSVTAYKQHAVPLAHEVAPHPTLGIIGQLLDAAVQLIEILICPELAPPLTVNAQSGAIRQMLTLGTLIRFSIADNGATIPARPKNRLLPKDASESGQNWQ